MKKYLQTSNRHYLDTETWKIIKQGQLVKPFEMVVPFWYWHFKEATERCVRGMPKIIDGKPKIPVSLFRKQHTVELNDLSVQFGDDFTHVLIKFFNVKRDRLSSIELATKLRWKWLPHLSTRSFLGGVDYKCVLDDETPAKIETKFYQTLLSAPNFCSIPNLSLDEKNSDEREMLYYGILPWQMDVKYKETWLNGQSWALLCGTWAILLSDDFKFDSLVALSGATCTTLVAERFLFTVNSYIRRMIFLAR